MWPLHSWRYQGRQHRYVVRRFSMLPQKQCATGPMFGWEMRAVQQRLPVKQYSYIFDNIYEYVCFLRAFMVACMAAAI